MVLFHTWTVTKELFFQAIHEKQSMDLNVCIDDQGHPYLGHPKEYHEKTHEPFFDSMPLWEAVEALADSNIPVIVDCKHFGAWPVVEDVRKRLHSGRDPKMYGEETRKQKPRSCRAQELAPKPCPGKMCGRKGVLLNSVRWTRSSRRQTCDERLTRKEKTGIQYICTPASKRQRPS